MSLGPVNAFSTSSGQSKISSHTRLPQHLVRSSCTEATIDNHLKTHVFATNPQSLFFRMDPKRRRGRRLKEVDTILSLVCCTHRELLLNKRENLTRSCREQLATKKKTITISANGMLWQLDQICLHRTNRIEVWGRR